MAPRPNCLKVAITKTYKDYDPSRLITTDHVFVIQSITGRLLEVGEDNSLYSAVAESWTVSPDHTSFTFRISANARFSDGSRITAEDVVYSLKRQLILSGTHIELRNKILGGDSFKNIHDPIAGIEAISSNEVKISINFSDEKFLYWIAFPETVIVPKAEAIKGQNEMSFAVTSGAYSIQENAGVIRLKKNPYFYFEHGSAADCIEIHGYEDPELLASDLDQQKIDLIDYGAVFSPTFAKFLDNPKFSIETGESKSLVYLVFNTTTEASKLSSRIYTRSKVQGKALIPYGAGVIFNPANQFLIDIQQGFLTDKEVIAAQASAVEPIAPEKLRVLYPAVFGERYLNFLRTQLSKQTNLQVEIVTYPEGQVGEALAKNNWDAMFYLVGMGEKATSILFGYHFKGTNPLYRWQDSEIDEAMQKISTADHEAQRLEQYKIISKRLLEQAYIIPIATFKWPVIMRSDLFFEKKNHFQWEHPIWALSWKD